MFPIWRNESITRYHLAETCLCSSYFSSKDLMPFIDLDSLKSKKISKPFFIPGNFLGYVRD